MAGFTEENYEQSQDTAQGGTPKGSDTSGGSGKGDGNAPKGSAQWYEQQEKGQDSPTLPPIKGTAEWAEQEGEEGHDSGSTAEQNSQTGGNRPSAPTDTEHETPAATTDMPSVTTERQRAEATAGTNRQIKSIQDWMDAEENRPETVEERKKRERREKSKKIIAAISEGIGALSNLFFTTRYAPNMYNHGKGGMVNAVDGQIERLKAEREKKRDEYLNFALKLGDLENDRAKTLRELEAQQERQKLAREKAQREVEAHGWLAALQPDKLKEQAGKANKAEQEAITAQAEAEAAPEMQQAKLATERARKGSLDASAANSRASAAAHGRSNVSEFSAWDEHGKEHKFRKKAAADAFAKQHGTWKEENNKETTTTETRRTPQSRAQQRTSTKIRTVGYPSRPQPKRNNSYSNTKKLGL